MAISSILTAVFKMAVDISCRSQVGTDAEYPPFEKQVGGKIVGFDLNVLNAVSQAECMKVNLQHTGWDPLFDGIDKGKVGMKIFSVFW